MLHTLAVPLDGSELAERALPYAIKLASARGGRLVLVRIALGPLPSGANWEQQQLDAVTEAQGYLAGISERMTPRVPTETCVAYGHAANGILDVVREIGADGIVIATHGRTGLAHLVYGSVTETILKHSGVPVLVVHARAGEAPATPVDPGSARIIVPLDGSSLAEEALPVALEMLGIAGELVLVSVVSPPDKVLIDEAGHVRAYLDQQEEAATREAHDYLRETAARLQKAQPGLHVACDVRIGEPAPGIVLATLDRGGDLVVMATHGRTGLGRALVGSVAGDVLRTGTTPVVMVRSTTSASADSTQPERPAVPVSASPA
jgi:nucleotide-binding universal stress UspA family protein